jgi:D-cysteine desulfhydrase family pyridoxal phosphate-dependent enzyme
MQNRDSLARELSFIEKIEELPKLKISHLPTPLEPMKRLSQAAGANLFVKRDDQTGLAFGGNKARKLEYILADVLGRGADSIITWGGVQSNWCRQVAAAAKRVAVRPVLILFKRPAFSPDYDGNLLLDFLLDTDARIIEIEAGKSIMEFAEVKEIVEAIAEEERRNERKPYIVPIGGSMVEGSMDVPWGAISYVNAFAEIYRQAQSERVRFDYIVLATGSGSTQAGLVAGAKAISPEVKVVGISVSEDKERMVACVETIARQTCDYLGILSSLGREDIIVFADYIRGGYGVLDKETAEAIRLMAATEGILLDPVYTGRAMLGLLDLIGQGYFEDGANILFLHTGGTPALFPYREKLMEYLRA